MVERQISVSADRSDTGQLQFLRFLAFINVFLWHGNYWVFWKFPLENACTSSVSFFVVLSGVLSGYSAGYKNTTFSFSKYCKYMWGKVKKIYPVHALTTVSMLFFTGIPYALALHKYSMVSGYLKQLAINLLFLQSWFTKGYFDYNGVTWFLSTILFLYLFNIPVSILLSRITKSKKCFLQLITCLVVIICTSIIYCYVTRNLNTEYWHHIFPPARLGEYLGGMFFGCILHLLKKEFPDMKNNTVFFTVLEIFALAFWVGSLFLSFAAWTYASLIWLAPNFLLLGVFVFGKGYISSLFRCKILTHLGDISFYCYIVHMVVIRCYLQSTGLESVSRIGDVLSLSLCLFVTVLLSHLLHNGSVGQKNTNT